MAAADNPGFVWPELCRLRECPDRLGDGVPHQPDRLEWTTGDNQRRQLMGSAADLRGPDRTQWRRILECDQRLDGRSGDLFGSELEWRHLPHGERWQHLDETVRAVVRPRILRT